MKKMLLIILILFNTCTVFSQTSDKNISEFIASYKQFFSPLEPGSTLPSLSKFTITLIIIPVKQNYVVDTLYLSDNAPKWQKDEVKGMLKRVKLFKISQYAKQKKFTGKIVFPFIFKTEKLNKKVELSEVYDSLQFLFNEKGNPIMDKVLLQEPIIVTETDSWWY